MANRALSNAIYKIGAVSSLSGVPTPTLRSWESRYSAFTPQKSQGKHRLYSDDDLLKATLLKRLIERGHGIGRIASLDTRELNDLLQKLAAVEAVKPMSANGSPLKMVVVGLALAGRIESAAFAQIFKTHAIRVTDIFADIPEALNSPSREFPQILLIRINSLHSLARIEIHKLIEQFCNPQIIVLYGFGQDQVIQSMTQSGMIVRKEPVADVELADLISSVLLIGSAENPNNLIPGKPIPRRKFSDVALSKVASISTSVLCECPRHVAEIISQLASFEQYSHECLNRSLEDAHVHAHLRSVSGSARALFEDALQMIAQHEGFDLTEIAKSTAR